MFTVKKIERMNCTKTNQLILQKMAAPDLNLLETIKRTHWTSHNIPLTFSESTLGKSQPVIADEERTRAIKNILYLFAGRQGSLAGRVALDLGCLEGGLAFEMAREDMKVLGVEGRDSNYLKCKLIQEYFEMPNLEFIHLDVRKLNKTSHGVFDVVLCCGLLYHLDNPFEFLARLYDMTNDSSVLFLDTHFAPSDGESLDAFRYKHQLSSIDTYQYDGRRYEGRWYTEYPDELEPCSHPWAALSNSRSFWPSHDSLIKALFHAGFRNIYNVYGAFDIELEYSLRKEFSRLFCFAVKETFFGRFSRSPLNSAIAEGAGT